MTFYYSTSQTVIGPFSVAVNESNNVVATAFGRLAALQSRLSKCHLLSDIQKCAGVQKQVEEYFSGKRVMFDLELAPQGTAFQHAVWDALREIPWGQTRSYGQIAATLGRPKSARAVGRANATNPICLIVPCHRVIGANGLLTGFAFGEKIKAELLRHEGALPPSLV